MATATALAVMSSCMTDNTISVSPLVSLRLELSEELQRSLFVSDESLTGHPSEPLLSIEDKGVTPGGQRLSSMADNPFPETKLFSGNENNGLLSQERVFSSPEDSEIKEKAPVKREGKTVASLPDPLMVTLRIYVEESLTRTRNVRFDLIDGAQGPFYLASEGFEVPVKVPVRLSISARINEKNITGESEPVVLNPGEEHKIITITIAPGETIPVVTTVPPFEITSDSAKTGGEIEDDGGAAITGRGVCYGLNPEPSLDDDCLSPVGETNPFEVTLEGLEPETVYHVRAFATNSVGTGYGLSHSFNTLAEETGDFITDIDGNRYRTVLIGSQEWMAENLRVTRFNNGDPLPKLETHAEWGAADEPAYTFYLHLGVGSEEDVIAAYGKLYNWYAVNDSRGLCPEGWTLPSNNDWEELPHYIIDNYETITENNAGNALKSCRQVFSPLGGDCATSEHPRWDSSPTHHGTDAFDFSALPGGIRSTNMYSGLGWIAGWWSATETSDQQARYRRLVSTQGNFQSLNTDKRYGISIRCFRYNGVQAQVPEVSDVSVSEITTNSMVAEGSVTEHGGAYVFSRGFVWNTTGNPTVEMNDGMTEEGTGTGSFSSSISGLNPETTYYIRAYATNRMGTGFGAENDFTTDGIPPSVTTLTPFDIRTNTAKAGGNVLNEGTSPVTSRGVCLGLNMEPDLSNDCFAGGSGSGSFEVTMDGLDPETTYHIRAYATNGAGTAFGSNIEFTTLENYMTSGAGVTDINGNEYPTVIIGGQEWMAENLRTTNYADGSDITTGLSNAEWINAGQTQRGAYAVYGHEEIDGLDSTEDVIQAYGLLYNWFAVNDNRDICPEGWHVPTETEWTTLLDYLETQGFLNQFSGAQTAGNALKSCRQVDSPWAPGCDVEEHPRWNADNSQYGTDRFGFAALPGGQRTASAGEFNYVGYGGYWWSSTEMDINNASPLFLYSAGSYVYRSAANKIAGFSVRCLKD